MGQAKSRGTFEQRQAKAIERDEALLQSQHEKLERYEVLPTENMPQPKRVSVMRGRDVLALTMLSALAATPINTKFNSD